MTRTRTIAPAGLALMLAISPVAAQQLENKTTQATSGTTGRGTQGRLSGANLSAGGGGPASETRMPEPEPPANGRDAGTAHDGASPATKELFQH